MSYFDTSDNKDLLWGSAASVAAFLGITVRQANRYKADPSKLPPMAVRLLKLRYGDLAGLLDSTWQGFTFRQGELFVPGFKYGCSAQDISGWFYGRQELRAVKLDNAALREQLLALKTELHNAKTALWAAQKLSAIRLGETYTEPPTTFDAREAPVMRATLLDTRKASK